MEIITGVERRRRWRLEEKLRIVAEVEQPGASFAAVARRHEVSRGLLWNWRAQVRSGALAPEPMARFMPVRITGNMPLLGHPVPTHAAPGLPGPSPAPAPAPAQERIEIALPDGTCIRVGTDIGLAALRRVMAAVRR